MSNATINNRLSAMTDINGVVDRVKFRQLLTDAGLLDEFVEFIAGQTVPNNGYYRWDVDKFLHEEPITD